MPFGFNAVRGKVLTDEDTISGRVYVLGLSVQPAYDAAGDAAAVKVGGLIQLKNGSDDTGDVLIEVPIVMMEYFPAGIGFDYVEHGGYVLFPDGLYVDITLTDDNPDDMAFSVSYQV